MKGELFTKIGLISFALGLILLFCWTTIYSKEYDMILDGTYETQNSQSRAILMSGYVFTGIGYALCMFGYGAATDFLGFKLKMPENNLIEK